MERSSTKRVIIGILLICIAIAGLVLWETEGRKAILYDTAYVAAVDIKAGDEITLDKLTEREFLRQNIIKNAIKTTNEAEFEGKIVKQYIPAGSQISSEFIYSDDFYIDENQSLFVIPETWISSRSSSIRRGDIIEVWVEGAKYKVGEYRVAFVKGEKEAEIVNIDEQEYADPLDRTNPTAVTTHIEIIAEIGDYKTLYEIATGEDYEEGQKVEETEEQEVVTKFLLVQKAGVK